MSKSLDRRSFLRGSLAGSAAFASAMSLEEQALLAAMKDDSPRLRENAIIAKNVLTGPLNRRRPWRA